MAKGETGRYGVVANQVSVADVQASGDDLHMFRDGELDYVVSRHNLEHYIDIVKTLLEWRRRFAANRHRAVRAFGDRFCRMWEFYLAGAEMAFRYQGQVVFQLQFAKRVDTLPLSRDYMIERREWNNAGNARVEMVNGSVDAVEAHAGEALNEFLSQNW